MADDYETREGGLHDMPASARKRRRVAVLVLALTAFAIAAPIIVHLVNERRLAARVAAAREAVLGAESPASEVPAGLEELFAEGERAFPVLERLLLDADVDVWAPAVESIDLGFPPAWGSSWDTDSSFQRFLRRASEVAWLRYQLVQPFQHGTDWRGAGDVADPRYWGGAVGHLPACSHAGVQALRELLFLDRDELVPDSRFSRYWSAQAGGGGLRRRAIIALGVRASSRSSESQTREQDAGAGPSEAAWQLLVDVARLHESPFFKHAAVEQLLRVAGFGTDSVDSVFLHPSDVDSCERALEEACEGTLRPQAVRALAALTYVDRAFTLEVLARLSSDPELESLVDDALREPPPDWPLERPAWRPLEASASRFLSRADPVERARAIAALRALGSESAKCTLATFLRSESDVEVRILALAAVVALGTTESLPELEEAIDSRLARREARVPDASNDAFIAPLDTLVRGALDAGSLTVFERVIEHQLRELRAGDDCLHVRLSNWSDLPPDAEPFGDLPDGVVDFTWDGWEPEDWRALEDWWRAHRGRLAWDAEARKFRARE